MRAAFWVPVALIVLGCRATQPADPQDAAREFAKALERGDTEQVLSRLTRASRNEYGHERVRQLLREQSRELKAKGQAFESPGIEVQPRAQVVFTDGRIASMVLEEGRFQLDSTGALPSHPKTPVEALEALRGALTRLRLTSLLRTLSPRARASLEVDLQGLLEALRAPESATIDVRGDRATAVLRGGYVIGLVLDDGVWFIEDFQ